MLSSNQNDIEHLLSQLKDLHLPGSLPFEISAIAILAIIVFIIILGVAIYWNRKCYYSPKRIALRTLQKLQKSPSSQTIQQLSILLRRCALAYFPRQTVAGLAGQAWLNFLNKTGNTKDFTSSEGELLISAPYQSTANHNLTKLFKITYKWIKNR